MNPVDRDVLVWALQRRLAMVLAVMLAVMLLLLLRSWYLQVLQHDQYSILAENNRVRGVAEKPERGMIFDRTGHLLVRNVPSFDLALVLDDVRGLSDTVNGLAELLDLDAEPMVKAAKRQRRTVPYLPVTIHENLTLAEVSRVEWAQLPGVVVLGAAKRDYVYGATASHLLGYVGDITETQLGNDDYRGVLPGTRVGQSGAEFSFDSALRGVPGKRRIEVDAKGFEVRELSRMPPQGGNDVYLSIDITVQQAAEKALNGRPGAVVALDPRNGQVIALASAPGVDLQALSSGVSSAHWKAILADPERPLINRAVQGVYPPGSIFKIPVAIALLETMGTEENHFCNGKYPFMGRTYRDWKKNGHGLMNLHDAIVQSCDVYFYEYGHRMGINTIADYAGQFGFGRVTGIDLPGERAGLLPSTAWKKKARGEVWFPGETLSAAIGQGYVGTTPAQVAAFMAAVAAKGVRHVPTVYLGEWHQDVAQLSLKIPEIIDTVSMKSSTQKAIVRALKGVVREGKGTGRAAYSKLATVAGKTGTAQVVSLAADDDDKKKDKKVIPRRLRDHAWFAAFAPADDPRIAVAVLVEHGGHGGGVAGPVVRQVIESYLTSVDADVSDGTVRKVLMDSRQRHPGG